jgi:quercetin dioxygenase-like cupin family protein
MRIPYLALIVRLFMMPSSAQQPGTQQPIAVDQEPHHKVVLKNDFVEVMHVTLAVDERTMYHTHMHDRAAVELSNTFISQQGVGGTEDPAQSTKPGDVSIGTARAGGYSHRVHNVGPEVFNVIDVEFLQRSDQPSAATAGPVAGENPSARAYRWELAPGAKTPEHTHKQPYLIVAATPMQLKMTAPDGQSRAESVKAGDFHWVDAQVTHTLSNEGTTAGTIVELELK